MKSKKALYILLPLVLLIWGIVIYRIFTSIGGDEVNPALQVTTIERMETSGVNDTFSLIADYRDPFLGNIATATVKQVVKKVILKPKPEPAPIVPWPLLTYSGMIRNQHKNKMLAILSINGQGYMMSNGEIKDGIQLLSANRDSAVVVFNKEKKSIKKI